MELLKPARDEILSIEKRIADAVARLKDLRAFVEAGERLYGAQGGEPSIQNSGEGLPLPSFVEGDLRPARYSASAKDAFVPVPSQSKAQLIVARVELALEGGRHMQSKELVGLLKDFGVDLGADPISSLSAYLSKSGRFVSERAKGGWAIKNQPRKEAPPSDVGASAGA